MKSAILASLLLTFASAATIPSIHISAPPPTEDTHAIFFPGTAQADIHDGKARTQITNAELLKMGQPIARPVKLYDAIALAKRINPAPAQASSVPAAGGTPVNYRFVTCTTSFNTDNIDPYDTGSGSLQQKANACATRSQADGAANNNIVRFALFPDDAGNCYTQVYNYNSKSCSSNNAAIYEIIP